jgi:N4-gp56 family major capsid protein
MAGHRFATDTARIGAVKGMILQHAMFEECLSSAGETEQMPKNSGKVLKWKRFIVPSGTGAAGTDNQWVAPGQDDEIVDFHRTAEGVTRGAESISSTIITATPYQFDVLYTYSNETAELYEDDIPAQEVEFAGQRIRLVRELYNYGKLKAATNAFYGGTGSSTATVNGTITKNLLEKVKRDLKRYYAKPQHKALKAGPEYAVYPIQASYPVYCHPDLEFDIRALADFKGVEEYGTQQPISPAEIGSAYGFRFMLSPELTYYPGGGAAVGATGLKATSSVIDVYPMIVLGQNSFKQVALRGMDSIDANHIPHNVKSKSDPGGQRGYVWAGTWHAAEITNQDWMAVVEVGATDL